MVGGLVLFLSSFFLVSSMQRHLRVKEKKCNLTRKYLIALLLIMVSMCMYRVPLKQFVRNMKRNFECERILDPSVYELIRSRTDLPTVHGYKKIEKCGQIFFESVRMQREANFSSAAETYAEEMRRTFGTGFMDFQVPDSAFFAVDFGLTSFPATQDCSSRAKNSSIYLSSMVTVDSFRVALIESFLDYYISIGINPENILFTVQLRRNSQLTQLVQIIDIIREKGVYHDVLIGNWSSESLMFHQAHKLLYCTTIQDWIIVADSDEFHEYPGRVVTKFFRELDLDGVNVVNGLFLDRVSTDGSLKALIDGVHVFKQFELGCRLHRVFGLGTPKKVMAFKGNFRINRGHHRLALCWFWNRRNYLDLTPWKTCPPKESERIKTYRKRLNVHHFKWMKGQYEATQYKAEVWKGTSVGKSYEKTLQHFEQCSDICIKSAKMRCVKQKTLV